MTYAHPASVQSVLSSLLDFARSHLQERISLAMRNEEASPKPCPDILVDYADLWNACDYATSELELGKVADQFDAIENPHVTLARKLAVAERARRQGWKRQVVHAQAIRSNERGTAFGLMDIAAASRRMGQFSYARHAIADLNSSRSLTLAPLIRLNG